MGKVVWAMFSTRLAAQRHLQASGPPGTQRPEDCYWTCAARITRLIGWPALSPAGLTRWQSAGRMLLKVFYLLARRIPSLVALVSEWTGRARLPELARPLRRLPGWDQRWVIFSVGYMLARRFLGCLMVLARREVPRDGSL
jgi:hypothetical protein